jgi:organic hydroperoxide reductase OsmC/OhrA
VEPEHLLLVAVATCFVFTLRTVATASRTESESCELIADGTVARVNGVAQLTEIVLRPRLRLAPESSLDQARRAMKRTEHACLVSAALATPIRLETEVS